jgi:hypothetical protein
MSNGSEVERESLYGRGEVEWDGPLDDAEEVAELNSRVESPEDVQTEEVSGEERGEREEVCVPSADV